MKLLGGLLVTVGGFGIGKSYCSVLKGRYLDLLEILECIRLLEGEIRYSNAPLGEIFGRIQKKRPGIIGNFFGNVGVEMKKMNGRTLQNIWNEQVFTLEKRTRLIKTDLENLDNFGRSLGIMDTLMQTNQLELYTKRLNAGILEAKENWKEKEKLVPKLGLVFGMAVVLILI